jgi:hypothetical protein
MGTAEDTGSNPVVSNFMGIWRKGNARHLTRNTVYEKVRLWT